MKALYIIHCFVLAVFRAIHLEVYNNEYFLIDFLNLWKIMKVIHEFMSLLQELSKDTSIKDLLKRQYEFCKDVRALQQLMVSYIK